MCSTQLSHLFSCSRAFFQSNLQFVEDRIHITLLSEYSCVVFYCGGQVAANSAFPHFAVLNYLSQRLKSCEGTRKFGRAMTKQWTWTIHKNYIKRFLRGSQSEKVWQKYYSSIHICLIVLRGIQNDNLRPFKDRALAVLE